ncbi:hypothetical protein C8024_00740 [Sphingopyxis sp. BSNA05]|nr:hypothetical protein [Sphingopyxis sp. BSNA05]
MPEKLATAREIDQITLHHDLHSKRQEQAPIAAGGGHRHHGFLPKRTIWMGSQNGIKRYGRKYNLAGFVEAF